MPPRSISDVSYAKTTLPYPVFAAEFDPYNRGYLVVGGGGGESKSGVPNQISILDVSSRAEITTAAEIELSRDEDSVQSVGSLATKDGLILFAGINSSVKHQEAGKNEHLRSFEVKYPPRKKQKTEKSDEGEKGQWKALGKRSLFKTAEGAKKETYQRTLRLSPSQKRESGSKRIGAIASGLAKRSELIVFNATTPTPDDADILTRIELDDHQEAADLDIATTGEFEFSVAYCTDDGIHEQTFKYDFDSRKAEKTPKGPRRVYHMPFPDTMEDPKSRPKFRCLRFLNPQNVVVICNKPNKKGAEMRIFHLYPTGPAMMMQQHKLPSHVKQVVSMDICALDADKDGNQQFIVAVAGSDISIEVFTTNYQRSTDTFSSFRSYISLKDVHVQQMTKICFSPFHSPQQLLPRTFENVSVTGNERMHLGNKPDDLPRPTKQYIRLASVSYGNTVVVDTFPVQPFNPDDKQTRYVLSHPSDEAFAKWTYVFIGSMIVVVLAFLIQSFRTGFSGNDASGPYSLLPKHWREALDRPAIEAYGVTKVPTSATTDTLPVNIPVESAKDAKGRIQILRDRHDIPHPEKVLVSEPESESQPEDQKEKTLIVRSAPEGVEGVTVDVHPDKEAYRVKDENAKHWDELHEHEKVRWMDRLKKAGQWAESEGESVLKGILFSEYAGIVGNAAGEILREL